MSSFRHDLRKSATIDTAGEGVANTEGKAKMERVYFYVDKKEKRLRMYIDHYRPLLQKESSRTKKTKIVISKYLQEAA